jgi:hypothetical protein
VSPEEAIQLGVDSIDAVLAKVDVEQRAAVALALASHAKQRAGASRTDSGRVTFDVRTVPPKGKP